MKKILLCLAAAASLFTLAACQDSQPSGATGPGAKSGQWTTYERAAEYPGMVLVTGLKIPMSDGVNISASVALPADAGGNPVAGRYPVVLTQTGYNKSIASVVPAFPTFNESLVTRGYAHVAVDVRGTGMSEGDWEAFSAREQLDYKEVMDWVAVQDWSNGAVGTWGPSFMGITQIFTAAHQHPAHKAVFAIVPMADAYRDITFAGGQVNAGFIPLWMGLVTALGVIPAEPDPAAVPLILEHAIHAVNGFQVPTIAGSLLGTGHIYDSSFWRERSPIEVADRVKIPTFVVGGLNDLFQRGEPMLYEAIKRNTTAKLLLGPWTHLGGSSGAGLPVDGVPSLDAIALMWFDRYLRGMNTGAENVPNVTQYYYGDEKYHTANDWPHPQARAERWHLRGDRSLTREAAGADEGANITLQQPLNGVCSTSTAQWTAGLLSEVPAPLLPPCFNGDNTINELLLEVPFTTAAMDQDYAINGPIQADIWVSSTTLNSSMLVRITDVSPEGTSREITNGILTSSFRAVDESRSRYLNGEMIQPWHPFTQSSEEPVGINAIVKVPVEVFPSSFVIKAGHRLRVTVSASDFPHGLPPLPDLLEMPVGVLSIYSDAGHPSSVVVPVVPASALN